MVFDFHFVSSTAKNEAMKRRSVIQTYVDLCSLHLNAVRFLITADSFGG